MGQKANPTSLRLKTTNKSFDSCWYSDLHYSTLLGLELKARSHIDKVFEQIRYPKPLVSLSLLPKRAKILLLYFNPERSRGERSERFQLRPFMSPRLPDRRAHPLPTRSLASQDDARAATGSTHRQPYPQGYALRIPRGKAIDPLSKEASGHSLESASRLMKSNPTRGRMPDWERKLFIYSTLLSIRRSRGNTARLLSDRDFALFYGVHRLLWFEGRSESCLPSTNQRRSHACVEKASLCDARAESNRVKRPNQREAPPYKFRSELSNSSRSPDRGRYASLGRPARGLHTLCLLKSPPYSVSPRLCLEPASCAMHQTNSKGMVLMLTPVRAPGSALRHSLACDADHRTPSPIAKQWDRGVQAQQGLRGASGSPSALLCNAGTRSWCKPSTPMEGALCWTNTTTCPERSLSTTTGIGGSMRPPAGVKPRSLAGSPLSRLGRRGESLLGRQAPAFGPRNIENGPIGRPRAGAFPQGYALSLPRLSSVTSIREIRRQGHHSSIALMEAALGRGLGLPVTMYPYQSIEEEQTAQFLSGEIAYYLERRVPFRRIKQALMRELQKRYIEGVRVSCSGRVGGRSKKAQRAREESFQWGQTSSHVFSSKLSFASRSALTPFGKVGIKVWICYR